MNSALALVPEVDLVQRPVLHLPGPPDTYRQGQQGGLLEDSTEDGATATPRTASLAADPGVYLPRRARHLAMAACRAWGLPHLADRAALVADELVTNAVVHAGTFVELHLRERAGDLVVAVHDRDARLDPSWWDCAPGPDAEHLPNGGYGLCLVRRSVQRCGGYQHSEGGKVMWAVLSAEDEPSPGGGEQLSDREAPGSAAPPAVVRRAVLVNGVRRRVHHRQARWRLELILAWHAADPAWVELSLRPTPLHPALPHGHWRVRLDVLVAGLAAPAGARGVRLYPDPGGQNVLLELPGDPPHVVHAPLRQLQAFLEDVGLDEPGRMPAAVGGGPGR